MSHFERFDHMKSHVHGATLCSSSAIFGKSPVLRKQFWRRALIFSPWHQIAFATGVRTMGWVSGRRPVRRAFGVRAASVRDSIARGAATKPVTSPLSHSTGLAA
jgi:hypothetical protein